MAFQSRTQCCRAAVFALVALWPCHGFAQPTVVAPSVAEASVSHAAAKGLTFRIGSILKHILIFSVGTGSVTAGGALTVITAASGYVVYTTNDYVWDWYSPNTNLAANNAKFNTSQSLWRNTEKYFTLKPVEMAATWSLIYAYTGSWAAALAMGSASAIAGPLVFYANNVAWDWYDWYSHPANPNSPIKSTHGLTPRAS